MKEFEQNNELDELQNELQDELQEDVYFEDEEGNLYSREEYSVDADGQLYYIDDYYEDEDGNLYPKDEYVLGDDGLLYTKEEFEELAISAGATTVLGGSEFVDGLEELELDDEEYQDDEEEDSVGGMFVRNGEASFFDNILASLKEVHIMDMVIAFTGVVVLLGVVIALLAWRNAGQVDDQVAAMATVGQELSSVTIAGNGNLVALKEAYVTKINLTPSVEEENLDNIQVVVNFTSIEKDLKIKFLNEETDELISGVLFKVELVAPSGTTTTLLDDNKDGIIYKTDLEAGTYQVTCLNVGGFEFPQTATPVTVKDQIVYQKVYIADEIKSEDDINASLEDVVVEEEVVEEKLVDTVEFVASTKTEVTGDAAYTEIDKSTIADPSLVSSRTSTLMAMATKVVGYTTMSLDESVSGNGTETTINVDEITVLGTNTVTVDSTTTLSATVSPSDATNPTVTWSSENPAVATVDSSTGAVKGIATGTAKITATASDGSNVTGSATVTVSAATVAVTGITVSGASTVQVGGEISLTAAVLPSNATTKGVTWTSSNTNYATVSDSGVVKGIAAGPVTITATAQDESGVAGTLDITVTAATTYVQSVTPSVTSTSVKAGETTTLSATVAGESGCETGVTWALSNSSDSTYLTIDSSSGIVTALSPTSSAVNVTVTTVGTSDAAGTKLTATVAITVTSNTSVALDQSSLSLKVSETYKLTTTVTNLSNTTVTYTTNDSSIATVATDGTVTGVKIGTTQVYATASDGTKVTCTVTVVTNPALDTTTELKDTNGVTVYVKDGSTYRVAVYADYYTTGAKYYIKGSTQYTYTGWQTINNQTYYYDKNGNKVTGTQVIQGVQYTFASDGTLSMGSGTLGIDVSKWNGDINWTAVKNSGVSYVIIRCGYRGYSTGVLVEDPTFKTNIEGAIAAGIKVGVYFFSQAITEVEAVQEASMVIDMIDSYRISYPVFIDIEASGGRADSLSNTTRTAVANAFCATVQNSGYTAGVYANKDWMTNKLNMSQLTAYKIWLAQYSTQPTYSGRYDLWQYSQTGRIGGISTDVDLNESYLGY